MGFELLDTLLTTLIREVNEGRDPEAAELARRFCRSVIRVFVVTSVCSPPPGAASKRGGGASAADAIAKCRRVFAALVPYAMPELSNAAEAVLAPVRLGVLKPTAAFPTSAALAADFPQRLFGDQARSMLGICERVSKLTLRMFHWVYILVREYF